MRAATEGFAALVGGSNEFAVRCDVLLDREVIAEDLPVSAGAVDANRTRAILSNLAITIVDPTRLPVSPSDVLTPYGYELRVYRGINVLGTPELLPLGTFPIQQSFVNGRELATTIFAEDRARLVADAPFEDTYQVASGTNYATAIEALISDGVDGLTFDFPTTSYTAPTLTFTAQADRWEAAQRMAASIGHELYFDGLGVCTMRPEPSFKNTPQATIATGVNLIDGGLTLDRTTAYNRVIAIGRNAASGAQYRGVATDDDAASPTQYGGPFGRRVRFHYSEFYNSDAQAADGAAAILAANLGVAKSFDVTALPDPRLEPADVIQVADDALSIDATHIIDQHVIGLTAADPSSLVVRANQEAA